MSTLRLLASLIAFAPVLMGAPGSAASPDTELGSSPEVAPPADFQTVEEAVQPDTAIFAGGCFWCMEPPFDELDGVLSTTSGYAGGHVQNPTYDQVTAGGTGHRESVRVIYDPERVRYPQLLEAYWENVDPLDAGGQFCDRGRSYTTAIFAQDDEQAREAKASKREISDRLSALGHEEPVVTPVIAGAEFYSAEAYHQDYYQEHPVRYRFYYWRCGRAERLEEVWGE